MCKKERLKFIRLKTKDGNDTGKISFYCKVLEVTRQAFYEHLKNREKPWKYEALAAEIMKIHTEDEYNDTYGKVRMHQALMYRQPKGVDIPSQSTIYRIMKDIGLSNKLRRKPNGITKSDRKAKKSDDLLKRNFKANKPCEKCITDITEVKASDGKLYVSAIFDCYDACVVGLSMADNMKATLCVKTVENACRMYPEISGAILHSDRGSQYTSKEYRDTLKIFQLNQSMNSAGGKCHDNARCESMWARMKEELFYSRKKKSENYTIDELKSMIWRYFISYWNNRRVCSSNAGLPPMEKRNQFYKSKSVAA